MKKILTISFLLFFSFGFSQTIQHKINEIQKTVNQINKGKGYTTKRLEQEEFMKDATDNGGELIGYFKNGQLIKIEEIIGLSRCENNTTYYIKNNKLIFIHIQGKQDMSETGTRFNYKLRMECKYYFDKGKLIKSIAKGSTICQGEPDEDLYKESLEGFSEYYKLLKDKQ